MHDAIPVWLAVLAITVGSPFALYELWIKPTLLEERSENSEQDGTL